MTTPILELPELNPQQASPYVPVNATFRKLEAVVNLSVIARVSALPSGSPDNVDGDRYILTAADSGGLAGDIAYYSGGWRFCSPEVGWFAWSQIDAARYQYAETSPGVFAWIVFTVSGATLPVGGSTGQVLAKLSGTDGDAGWNDPFPGIVTDATTARTLALSDLSKYIRMTSGSANVVTVPANSTVAFPVGAEVHVRQASTGQTTIAAAGGVTINGNLTFAAQHDTKTLKKVATDVWDSIGGL